MEVVIKNIQTKNPKISKNSGRRKEKYFFIFIYLVPEVGIEPTWPYGHKILSLACIPIPPLGQIFVNTQRYFVLRPGAELNRRIFLLQRNALPLGYQALNFSLDLTRRQFFVGFFLQSQSQNLFEESCPILSFL